MTDQTKPQFDPRFSPAFQRGFAPEDSDATTAVPAEAYVAPSRGLISTPPQAAPVRSAPAPATETAATPAVAPPAALATPVAAPSDAAPSRFAPGAPAASRNSQPEPVLLDAPGDELVADSDAASAPVDRSGRNPFLIALGVVAIALVALGAWLFLRAGAAFNSREVRSQGDYMSLQATITAAPFVVLLGVATALAVLFVFALRWARRR